MMEDRAHQGKRDGSAGKKLRVEGENRLHKSPLHSTPVQGTPNTHSPLSLLSLVKQLFETIVHMHSLLVKSLNSKIKISSAVYMI